MAKFIEDRSSLKKKKKKETTAKKVAAPSSANKKQVSNVANQVVNRTANAAKRTTNTVGNSAQRQNTVRRNVQDSISRNAPQRYNNRPSGAAQPSTNHTVQDRLAASRQRREQAEADIKRRRQESEARSQRISQSRNPRMQDTARGTKLPTLEERRQKQDRLRQAQEQKMGNNSMASKEAQRTANRALKNTPTVAKESAKQVGIGHGKTFADITEANKSAAIGSKIDIKSKEFQEDIEKRRKESTRVAKSSFKTLSDMQEKSEAKMEKVTKDAKGLEKAYYGALESGVGMATDRLAGPAWAVSMLSRTYGNTRGQAQKEGATEDEDRAYSLLQAAKEVATEYMFQGVGLAKGLSGRHSLSLGEMAANALTKNMRGPLANATHAGIRLLGGVGEENAEEAIGWGLDPFIKEFTYGRNVRTRQAQQMMREQSDALRSNITSMDDARAIAAYLGSDDFLDSQIRTYMDSGIGKEEARDLAENMRDYLDASLSGDTEKMADIEESLSKKLSGRGVKDILKQDLSLSELKDTIASTTLLTATTGLPGTVTTTARGAAIKEQLGTDGIRALARTAEDFEDGEMQLKAKAMSERLDAGKDITSTQAYDLAVGVQEQYNKDADRQQTAYQTAQKTIKSEKLVTPYRVSRDGDIQMDEVTDKTYQSTAKSAKSAIETFIENSDGKESLTDTEIDRGSRAIAGFKTGVFTVDDANELNFRNTAVRSAFEKETGIDLSEYVVKGKDGQIDIPATNTATKNALFAKAADNLVATAQAETANWVDNTKGEVVTQISRRMGASGTAALQTALDDVDERDRSSYMMTANASDVLYQSARNMGTEWENAKDYAKRMFPDVAEDKLKAMYEAGLADRDMATDEARGQQIKIGEKIELKKNNDAPTGQVIVETSAPVKGSVIRTFTELARNLGVDIHLVDHFTDANGKVLKNVNGEYIDGNIFINVNSDFEKNMGFIFMHEVTHHLKMYAPEQYKALENLVREKWFKYDSAQMQSEIAKKIETYAKHGQTLTEEQALEEIIADAAHEFLTDRNFAREVANEDASLAQAVLTSIRNALRMLRRIMSADNLDETHMNTLFSQLDILDEAERLWLDAYKQAVRNNAAVEVDRLQNQIYEEGKQSATDSKASYSLSNMPSIDDLDMTNSTVEDENGDMVAEFKDNGSVRFSISSFEKSGRGIYQDYLNKQVKNGNLSRKEADDMMHELEAVYGIAKEFADKTDEKGDPIYAPFSAWSYADVVTDEKGKPVFSAIKKNSEYKMNIDFSTICKKRRTLDAVFREMINRGMFEKLDLNKDESAAMVVNINNLIRQHKFEAACALCFVEARRYRQQQTATTFRDMWNSIVESMYTGNNKAEYFNFGEDSTVEAVPNAIHTLDDSELDLTYVKKLANEKDDKGKLKQTAEAKAARLILKDPSQRKLMRVGDMMASTGFENMQIKNPELMKVYNSKKGTGGAKSSFGDVQYLNEILKPRSFSRKSAYAVSGVRIQSFSDYVPRMVFDYVQVIADLAAKHLPAHGYTKEPLFVKQFGLTGAKINMSLVPDVVPDGRAPGLDKDGNYIWNEEGTFPYDEAMAIQEAKGYKENCGTIAVGISDEHIMKMLADPTIQMVIPYHKSSLNPIVAAMTNVDRFENYEKVQTTKDENGNTVSKDFDWDNKLFRLSHDSKGKMLPKEQWGNVQDLVKEYADWCKAKNYTPKFPQFLYLEDGSINPGYYKLLEDFALLDNDGNFKPQGDVQMRFPTEDSAFGSMKGLIAQGLSEDTELEAKRSSEISGIVDEIEGMFDQGTLTEQSATSEKLAARMSISEDLDEPYMAAVNAGNMEEAKRLVGEAAKRAGYGYHAYHGTAGKRFYTFKPSENARFGSYKFGEHEVSYFTTARESAETYAENGTLYDVSLKLNHPYVIDNETDAESRTPFNIQNKVLRNWQWEHYNRVEDDLYLVSNVEEANNLLYPFRAEIREDGSGGYELWRLGNNSIWGMDAYISSSDTIDGLFEYDTKEELLGEKDDYYFTTDDVVAIVLAMSDTGYTSADGVIIPDILDAAGLTGKTGDDIIVFSPEQVKSADTVTYTEDGSVIPLSQRFDPTNNDIRYSMSTEDADGNVLTTNQMEYFKNSQARDENGRLVPVYHATRTAGFTVFDPTMAFDEVSISFTNDIDFALNYASEDGDIDDFQEAYDNRYGMEEVYSDLDHEVVGHYKVYLNMENPLVLEGDYLDEMSIYEWPVYAKDNGYDGVIYRDFDDIGSDIYQVFSSSQIKDTRNENPTENPDIRYSITEDEIKSGVDYEHATDMSYEELLMYEDMIANASESYDIESAFGKAFDGEKVSSFYSALTEEVGMVFDDEILEEGRMRMAKSKADFWSNLNTKWQERWVTKGEVLDTKSVKTNVRNLIRGVMNNSDTDRQYKTELVNKTLMDMRVAYQLMKQDRTDIASALLYHSALRMITDVDFVRDDTEYQEYKGIRDYLHGEPITVSDDYWQGKAFQQFRKEHYGTLKLRKGETNVDKVYMQLEELYPHIFNETEREKHGFGDAEEDLLQYIGFVTEQNMQPFMEAYSSEECAEWAFEIADDLYEILENGEGVTSLADRYKAKYDAKAKAMKTRHAEAILRVRKQKDAAIDALKEHYNERLDEQKARSKDAIRKEREKFRQQNQAAKKKAKERTLRKQMFESIKGDYDWLTKAVLDPTKTKYIPEAFRASLANLLMQMDLETARSKQLEEKYGRVTNKTLKLRELRDRLNDMATAKAGDDTNLFDIDQYLPYLMDSLAEKYDGQPISALDVDSLSTLKILFKALRKNFQNLNRESEESKAAIAAEKASRIVEESLQKVSRDGEAKTYEGLKGGMSTINMTALTPVYFFERMGTVNDIYKDLRGGFDTYIRNEADIMNKIKDIVGGYYKKRNIRKNRPTPGSELASWRDSRSAKEIKLTHGTVTMTVAQRMSLLCLANREQARKHMIKGGIVITPYETASKIEAFKEGRKGKNQWGDKVIFSADDFKADIDTIKASLTPEQIKVAQKLQQLMAVDMAKLGNEAHREMYGYEIFGEPDYFPIKSKDTWIAKDVNNMTDAVEKIKSFGPAKPLDVNASNAIVVDDIFSVVADHCNGMNLYNAYLVPISNFMRVYNSTPTLEDGTRKPVRDALEEAYGKKAMQYIDNFIRDLNGIKNNNRGGLEDLMNKAIGATKATAVAGNLRVAAQQPTAIVRAAAEMQWKYLAPFVKVKPQRGAMKEMFKYCPIAQWKSWGFYDTYMGRDIEDVMMNNWSKMDVALSGVYGKLDNLTWTAIWQGVKAEQHDLHPEMDIKSDEFLKMCGERASEIFDKTQVVDSTFHRSDAMRSKQVAVKLFTAFMSEPTLTLNVFRSALYDFGELKKAGKTGEANKRLAKALTVLVAQAAFVSVAQAAADAWRGKDPGFPWGDDDDDDDEESTYWERFLHNLAYDFIDQLHIENNLYLIKDVKPYVDFMASKAAEYAGLNPTIRALLGWDQEYLYNQNNLVFASLENTANGTAQLFKKLEKGDEYDKEWYDILQKLASGISPLLGIPAGTLMRDFKPIWNKVFSSVFAADKEASSETKSEKGENDSESKSGSKEKGKGKSSGEAPAVEEKEEYSTERGFFGLGKSEYQRHADDEKKDREKRIKEAKDLRSKTQNMSASDKDKAIWDSVSTYMEKQTGKSMTALVESADYDTIREYRAMYMQAGGDISQFDARIQKASKTALKRTLIDDPSPAQQEAQYYIRTYLERSGLSDAEMSEIVYKSDSCKDLKVAFRMNDEEAINYEMQKLANAGMRQVGFEKVYKNRMRLDLQKYDGKYKEKLKSTGKYLWPINGTLTSDFGHRSSPGGIGSTNHQGIDIAGNTGDPVAAADGGVVIKAGWYGGYGKTVQIQHDDGTITQYSHLSWWDAKVGDTVAQGQCIGNVGSTGNSTGPHLHFGVIKDGNYVDPMTYLNKKS